MPRWPAGYVKTGTRGNHTKKGVFLRFSAAESLQLDILADRWGMTKNAAVAALVTSAFEYDIAVPDWKLIARPIPCPRCKYPEIGVSRPRR
jgi:hypothetical protein